MNIFEEKPNWKYNTIPTDTGSTPYNNIINLPTKISTPNGKIVILFQNPVGCLLGYVLKTLVTV